MMKRITDVLPEVEGPAGTLPYSGYGESTPDGMDQHTPGAKLDHGKNRVSLVLGAFAHALWAVSEIGTAGAAKYTDNGWLEVDGWEERYDDAQMRHWLKKHMGQDIDPDSEQLHLAHEAWNALAKLERTIRENKAKTASDGYLSPQDLTDLGRYLMQQDQPESHHMYGIHNDED